MEFTDEKCVSCEISEVAAIVREFSVANGLHCYNSDGHAVYVSRGLIAIHGRADGVTELHFPQCQTIIPLFPKGETWEGRNFRLSISLGETLVYRLKSGKKQ